MENVQFTNPNDKENSKLHLLIRQWMKDKLSLEEPWALDIAEIKCSDPSCLHTDTFLTVTKGQNKRRFLVSKPLVYLRKWDIEGMKELPPKT